MTKIIYKSFLLAFATLASLACQPVEEAPSEESCWDENTVRLDDACDALAAIQTAKFCDCESKYCETRIERGHSECIAIKQKYGELSLCPYDLDVRDCIYALVNQKCDDEFNDIIGPCKGLAAN